MTDITIAPNELTRVGQNLGIVQKDNQLILVIDLDKTIGMSKGGKMMGIASTGGFAHISDLVTTRRGKPVSMNLYLGEK